MSNSRHLFQNISNLPLRSSNMKGANFSPMKKGVIFFLILFPVVAWTQFPAPASFQIRVNYIMLGESGWCDNHLVQGLA